MSEAVRVLKVFADLAGRLPECGGGGGVHHVLAPDLCTSYFLDEATATLRKEVTVGGIFLVYSRRYVSCVILYNSQTENDPVGDGMV